MSAADRKEVAALVREASAALSRIWKLAHVGTADDPALDRVVAGPILAAETHLWEARAALDRLTSPATQGVEA